MKIRYFFLKGERLITETNGSKLGWQNLCRPIFVTQTHKILLQYYWKLRDMFLFSEPLKNKTKRKYYYMSYVSIYICQRPDGWIQQHRQSLRTKYWYRKAHVNTPVHSRILEVHLWIRWKNWRTLSPYDNFKFLFTTERSSETINIRSVEILREGRAVTLYMKLSDMYFWVVLRQIFNLHEGLRSKIVRCYVNAGKQSM